MAAKPKCFNEMRRPDVLLVSCQIDSFSGLALLTEFFKQLNIQPCIVLEPVGNEVIVGEMVQIPRQSAP